MQQIKGNDGKLRGSIAQQLGNGGKSVEHGGSVGPTMEGATQGAQSKDNKVQRW